MSNGQSTLYGPGTVKRAFGFLTASGTTEVVAAQGAGKKIRVVACILAAPGTISTTMFGGGSAISGTMALDAATLPLPYLEVGWAETGPNEALQLNNTNANLMFFHFLYVVVD